MAGRVLEANQRSEHLIEGLLTLARSERRLRAAEPLELAMAAADALEAAPEVGRLGLGSARCWLRPRSPANAPAGTAGRQPGRERRPPQPARRVGRGRHRPRRPRVGGPGRQRRPHSPDQVATLFEPFRRLEADRTGSDRGAGLGLSIVRSVATAHGGTATATALPDGGLEVRVELPADAR